MSLLDDTCILVKPRALFFHGDHGEATRGEASRALGTTAAEDPWANGNGLKPREKMGKAGKMMRQSGKSRENWENDEK